MLLLKLEVPVTNFVKKGGATERVSVWVKFDNPAVTKEKIIIAAIYEAKKKFNKKHTREPGAWVEVDEKNIKELTRIIK